MEEEKFSDAEIAGAAGSAGTGGGAKAADNITSSAFPVTSFDGSTTGSYPANVKHILFPQGTDFDESKRRDLFEYYKLLAQNTEQTAMRRQMVNSFFLSINTALIAANGMIARETFSQKTPHRAEMLGAGIFMIVLSTIGLIVCRNWSLLIISYAQIMKANSMVAQQLEKYLLAALVTAQQTFYSKDFKSITKIERNVAFAFMAIYLISMIIALYMIYVWHTMPPMHPGTQLPTSTINAESTVTSIPATSTTTTEPAESSTPQSEMSKH